jgi:hypothetical protein
MRAIMADEQHKQGDADVIALLPWDLTVRRARTRKQAREILDRKDADQAIRGLSELEAYYLVKELGLEDSVPVLAMLEAHQIRALVDLDVWHDDHAELGDLLHWLYAFREAGTEHLARAVKSIDPELFSLLLSRRLLIALRPRDDQPPDPSMETPEWLANPSEEIEPLIETPDRGFIIAARAVEESFDREKRIDDEERKMLLEILEMLSREEDPSFMAHAFRSAEADLASSLEEDAFRFRSGRLEDLGFPPFERALEIYGPLDPEKVLGARERPSPPTDLMLPELHASRFSQGLFREVMQSVRDVELVRRVEGELLALANAAAVVDGIEAGDLEQLRDVLDRVRAYLELALAYRADPAAMIDVARTRIETHSVRTLFRVGYSITLALGTRAREIAATDAFKIGGDKLALLPERDRAVIGAVTRKRPAFARVLEEEGALAHDTRPFREPVDVDRVRASLDELAALAKATAKLDLANTTARLGDAIVPPMVERTVDLLLTTGAAHHILDGRFAIEPFVPRELAALRDLLDGRETFATDAVERAARAAIEAAGGAEAAIPVGRRVRAGLSALGEALSPLVGAGEIDPRFIGVVLAKRGA